MSEFFRDARDVTIASGSFNHVARDQHNHYYNGQMTVAQVEQTRVRTAFDEVRASREGLVTRELKADNLASTTM